MPDKTQYTDLGEENSWKKVPRELLDCMKENHTLTVERLNFCGTYNEYSCDECQIKYRVDSSD